MSLRSRALRLHPVLLGALLASGCAGVPIPESLRPDVGHVAGRVEHGERGVSVIHMQALAPSRAARRAEAPVRVTIEDGRQRPRIGVVRPGQPLLLANRDEIYHELVTVGPQGELRIRMRGGEESPAIRLGGRGLVLAYCRLHPHERYAFLVADADHVVYLEGEKEFRISEIPVGDYRISATALDGSSHERTIEVAADRTLRLVLRPERSGSR